MAQFTRRMWKAQGVVPSYCLKHRVKDFRLPKPDSAAIA
jgi:hypothetical protein